MMQHKGSGFESGHRFTASGCTYCLSHFLLGSQTLQKFGKVVDPLLAIHYIRVTKSYKALRFNFVNWAFESHYGLTWLIYKKIIKRHKKWVLYNC